VSGDFGTVRRPVWMEKPKKVTLAGKGVSLVVVVALVLFPLWVVVATSLSPDAQVIRQGGFSLWPEHLNLDGYRNVFNTGVVGHALQLSVVVTVVGTALSLAATATLAYALSRPIFGGKPLLLAILFTFLFPAGMIPSFLLVNNGFHLHNKIWSLILPGMVSVFNVVIMRGFFQGLPKELFEAARIDGASELRVLLRIVLPLSKAIMAVVGLFYAVGYWNGYINAMLYYDNISDMPFANQLRQFVIAGNSLNSEGSYTTATAPQVQLMALVVIAIVPIALAFPFLQRFFSKGVLTGAVKS
jgi:putative aldouronate transport system permease protein